MSRDARRKVFTSSTRPLISPRARTVYMTYGEYFIATRESRDATLVTLNEPY